MDYGKKIVIYAERSLCRVLDLDTMINLGTVVIIAIASGHLSFLDHSQDCSG
jgi:hypothetical protein